ncbi:hypothetical protein ACLB2K_000395 [Fragaria x ananassa]
MADVQYDVKVEVAPADIVIFDPSKKKKKKKVAIEDPADDTTDKEGEGIILEASNPYLDYEYEELLEAVNNILRENNPELAGEKRRTVMGPPQVLSEGTKKTVYANFMEHCKTIHRQPEHVQNFFLAELGIIGSLDGQQRLVVKGRFTSKNLERKLMRYVNDYVICLGCKSIDTVLSKESRLSYIRCEKCGSGRSVAPIRQGFVARVRRRHDGA